MSSAPQPESDLFFTNRFGTSHGKPNFPTIKDVPKSLAQLAGPSSVGFFRAMGLDYSFLEKEADTWEDLDSYQNAKSAVSAMKVVNDAAERGVKLGSDFLDTARKEEIWQDTLQVAENDRKRIPDQRRPNTKSENWYLALK